MVKNRISSFIVYWDPSEITLFIFYIFTWSQGKMSQIPALVAKVISTE